MSLKSFFQDIKSDRILLFALVAIALSRLVNGIVLSPIQDEMYYFYWARFLDWGYFDHPPLVAWTAAAGPYLPAQVWAARLGTLVLGCLSLPLLAGFFREVGLKDKAPFGAAMLLASGSFVGLLFGYLTTPDIPMIFCWIAALHECAKALGGQEKRWLSAGLFTGLGILGKYTMVLIGPVFLLALLFHPKKLKNPWPYLGGLLCVLVITPHILWLSQNEWITTRFQLGRGLMSQYGVAMQQGHDLPLATAALDSSKEAQLASHFVLPEDRRKVSKPKATGLKKAVQGMGDYLGGQLALWGLLLFPILYGFYRGRRRHFTARRWTWTSPAHGALVVSATLFPIALFLPLSAVQHIEANWPAMACIAGSALIVRYARVSRRLLVIGVASNIVLTLLLSLHTRSPLGFSKLRAILSLCLLSFIPAKAWASGITLHLWMAEKGAEYTQIPELHSFLDRHRAAFENGSIFPDSGYIIQHPYGEYAHWSGFLNAYYAEINERCPDLASEECADLFAHFLGSLSHVVADINFDRHFVAEEGRQDYGGNVDEAQKVTDPGIDFLAIIEHKRTFKVPEYRLPATVLETVFQRGGEVEALAADILKAMGIVRLGLASEPLGAPFAYFYYRNKMPWGSKNYMTARGGVEDTANRIAKAWELVWLAYHREDGRSKVLFSNKNAWPNADFYIDGHYLENF